MVRTVKTEKIRVWMESFLWRASEPQKEPTTLPQRANHILRDTRCKTYASVPSTLVCQRSDQLSTGSRHHIMMAPSRFSAWW